MDTDLIKPFHIKADNAGPHVLVTAGVHGDEYEPMLAALELIQELPGILTSGSVTVVPIVNEGAYLKGARCGEDGLDLARTCPGKPEGTITERIAREVSGLIRESDYYIDLHTGGRIFDIYPLSGYMLHASTEILEKQRNMAKAFNLPVVWGTNKDLDGRTISIARDANVPAIYVEYGGGDLINKKIIDSYRDGCMNVLRSLGMVAAGNPSRLEIGNSSKIIFWVEDDTSGSGYLQVKMPALLDGIFIPEVKVGDRVKRGQVWGTIKGPGTEQMKVVGAEEDGIVLFLRTTPLVHVGDSLGGVLPVFQKDKLYNS